MRVEGGGLRVEGGELRVEGGGNAVVTQVMMLKAWEMLVLLSQPEAPSGNTSPGTPPILNSPTLSFS